MHRPAIHSSGQRFGDLQVRLDLEIVEASVDGTLVRLLGDRAQTAQLAQEHEILKCNGAIQGHFDLAVVRLDRFPVVWRNGEIACTSPELEPVEDPLNQRSNAL